MKKVPYKWQKEAIKTKRDEEFFMLNASCGLGKTYTFIEIVRMDSLPKIIVAPNNICSQWKDELIDEGIDEKDIWVFSQPTMTKSPSLYQRTFVDWAKENGRYLIVPTQAFSNGVKGHKKKTPALLPFVVQIFLGLFKRDIFVVLDESSWIKANSAGKKQLSARSEMIQMLGSMANRRAAGTGTLMSKSPMNLYDQFEFLQPGFFYETRSEFYQKYTITKTYYYNKKQTVTAINKDEYSAIQEYLRNPNWGLSKYSGKDSDRDNHKIFSMASKYHISASDVMLIVESDRYWPYKNLDELFSRIEPYTVTVKREDVFDVSNDKFVYNPIVVPVDLSMEQRRLYQKLVDDGFSSEFYLGKAPAAELNIRLQDICLGYEPLKDDDGNISYRPFKENPKLEALIELLDQIDDEEQVVIWVSRTNALNSVAERLKKEGISYVTYSGAENAKEKKEAEQKIIKKEARVFIGNIAAGSFGLNALRNCNYIIWYCVNDSPEMIHQAQHRILRGESKTLKIAYSLFCSKTVEFKQFERNKNGEEFIKFRNTKEDFNYG